MAGHAAARPAALVTAVAALTLVVRACAVPARRGPPAGFEPCCGRCCRPLLFSPLRCTEPASGG